jgi:hypothetical protein
MNTAQLMGELTWQYGLVKESSDLCHGITGNGYMMHALFRTFYKASSIEGLPHEEQKKLIVLAVKWKSRAFCFAKALFDEEV